MELVLAVGSALGIGGTATTAATAVVPGIAGASTIVPAAAASGGSLMTSILQGTLTAFSAASAIGQGIAARSEGEVEAAGAAAQASREKIAADDEAVRINRALAEVIGEQSIAYAAAGIELGSGTPARAREEAKRRANEDLNINRSNRNAKVAAWNQRAFAARSRGEMAQRTGALNAGAALAQYGLDVANRGGPLTRAV